jgi:hypothetical protein
MNITPINIFVMNASEVIPPITDCNLITLYLLSRLQYAPPCNAYYLVVCKDYLTWFVDYEANIEGEPEELNPPYQLTSVIKAWLI